MPRRLLPGASIGVHSGPHPAQVPAAGPRKLGGPSSGLEVSWLFEKMAPEQRLAPEEALWTSVDLGAPSGDDSPLISMQPRATLGERGALPELQVTTMACLDCSARALPCCPLPLRQSPFLASEGIGALLLHASLPLITGLAAAKTAQLGKGPGAGRPRLHVLHHRCLCACQRPWYPLRGPLALSGLQTRSHERQAHIPLSRCLESNANLIPEVPVLPGLCHLTLQLTVHRPSPRIACVPDPSCRTGITAVGQIVDWQCTT